MSLENRISRDDLMLLENIADFLRTMGLLGLLPAVYRDKANLLDKRLNDLISILQSEQSQQSEKPVPLIDQLLHKSRERAIDPGLDAEERFANALVYIGDVIVHCFAPIVQTIEVEHE